MSKYLTLFLMAFLLLLSPPVSAHGETIQSTKQLALADWMVDNAQVSLSKTKVNTILTHVYQQAHERQMDPLLILSVMRTESGFKERSRSSGGALGLMQVIPYWHRDKLRGRNPMNPAVSIEVGARVLKDCWVKSKGNHLTTLSCYSGGGGKRYYKKVMSFKKEMRQAVIVSQFKNDEPLYDFSKTF
jgi:soluble lytic murein transglycosylase-like protein